MKKEIRLIDAHDLWSDIMMLPHIGDMISSEEVAQAIMDAPTVDAVEVVHARWVRYEHGSGIYCSHCRHKRRYRDINDNYCPNCGAKMDGGDGNV